MTHEFKPGDKVKHNCGDDIVTIVAQIDKLEVRDANGNTWLVRPSELTPADPGPDDATLLVRELCAAEFALKNLPLATSLCRDGEYDNDATELAFAKYIRANPPQPLTVERLAEAYSAAIFASECPADMPGCLHAALTEQRA